MRLLEPELAWKCSYLPAHAEAHTYYLPARTTGSASVRSSGTACEGPHAGGAPKGRGAACAFPVVGSARMGLSGNARLHHRRIQEPDRLVATEHGVRATNTGAHVRGAAGQWWLTIVQCGERAAAARSMVSHAARSCTPHARSCTRSPPHAHRLTPLLYLAPRTDTFGDAFISRPSQDADGLYDQSELGAKGVAGVL